VEGQVATIAAERATPEQLKELSGWLGKPMPTKLNASTVTQIVEANARFHISIAEMTQNHELVEMVRRLLDRSSRFVYLLKADRSVFQVHVIHQGIVSAIRKGDASKARQLIISDIRAGQSEFFA
jgi:DNA-binding GntR family transcriptional regulator